MAGGCRRFVTRDEANGGPEGHHLHTGPVTITDWPKPILRRTVTMVTARQCTKVMGVNLEYLEGLVTG